MARSRAGVAGEKSLVCSEIHGYRSQKGPLSRFVVRITYSSYSTEIAVPVKRDTLAGGFAVDEFTAIADCI